MQKKSSKKFIILWDDGRKIYVKTKQGNEIIENFEWYFCILRSEAKKNRKLLYDLKDRGLIRKFEREGEYIKVFCDYRRRRSLIGNHLAELQLFESDVKLFQRYLIDNELTLETDQKVLYFDLECTDLKPGINPGEEMIVSIAGIDNDGKEHFLTFRPEDEDMGGEYQLLQKFIKLTKKYDIVAGWHCLVPETKILTPDGFKLLKDLSVGEDVIGYSDSFKTTKVIRKKIQKAEGVYTIQTHTGNVRCSGNHKIFVWRPRTKYDAVFKYKQDIDFQEVQEINADQLQRGDYLLTPRKTLDLEETIRDYKKDDLYCGGFLLTRVVQIKFDKKETEVIDIETGTHNFIANNHLVHNSEGFDLVAVAKRCEKLGIPFKCRVTERTATDLGGLDSVRRLGNVRARPITFNHLDLMQKMKEMHYRDTELIKKVRSFSLSAVSQVILGEDKLSTEGRSMTSIWQDDPDLLKRYNMQDARLLQRLDEKLGITKQKIVEHEICGARLNDYTSYNRIDAFALRMAKKLGVRLKSKPQQDFWENQLPQKDEKNKGKNKDSGYTGGYVFDPIRGLHRDVHAFDIASMYPSIIRTFNISPEVHRGGKVRDEDKHFKLPTGEFFSKEPRGIIPIILTDLLDSRDEIRHVKMKKYEKDSFEWQNLYYRQYAFKVLANSMYGVMGAPFSRYYKKECAEGITLTGQYILKMIWHLLEEWGHEPLYGDSVTGDVPVYLRSKKTKRLEIRPIRELEKIYFDYEVLSQNGWTNIKSFYKHFVKKQGYKIVCRDGITKVTEDHSLMKDKKAVKPTELFIGDLVDIYKPEYTFNISENILDQSYAWALGYFTAEGSISKKESVFSISSAESTGIMRFAEITSNLVNKRISIKEYDRPNETKRSKKFYRVYCRSAIPFFKDCYTESYEKRVPENILNSPEHIKKAFLEGYFDGDGHYTGSGDFDRCSSKSLTLVAGIHYLLNSLGRTTNLIDRQDKFNVTRILVHQNSKDVRIREANQIKRIIKFKIDEEVYDLSTDSETFVAGVNLVHHNTDSVFSRLKKDTDPEELAKKVEKSLAKDFKKNFNVDQSGIKLGYEAHYKRFLLVDKKRYVGVTKDKEEKLMGLEVKKRDTLPIVEKWQRKLLDMLLYGDETEEEIKKWLETKRKFVARNKLKLEQITFQKRLSKEIEEYGQVSKKTGRKVPIPAHVKVAIWLKAQLSGRTDDKINLFSQGAYIPYYVIQSKKGIVAQHPSQFDGTYDIDYYWSRIISPSLERIMSAAFPESKLEWEDVEDSENNGKDNISKKSTKSKDKEGN